MLILLVEDIEDNRDFLRVMIESLGHEVLEAVNGKDGLRVALKQKPDLILMDLSMPEVDGFQATGAIRSISSLIHIPIIAVTAYPKHLWMEKAMDAGCDAFLSKPVSREALKEVIERFDGKA